MILLDLNLLIYAVNTDTAHHQKALRWLEATLGSDEPVGLSWSVILGFLRLSTRPGIFPRPLEPEQAFGIVDGWLERPSVRVLHPGEQHWSILRSLLQEAGTAGNLTSDAHLAALALEYGATLCSTDNDFARFSGLRFENPLKGSR